MSSLCILLCQYDQHCQKIFQCQVRLFPASSVDPLKAFANEDRSSGEFDSPFVFTGDVHDSSVSESDVIKSGKYLRLCDAQVLGNVSNIFNQALFLGRVECLQFAGVFLLPYQVLYWGDTGMGEISKTKTSKQKDTVRSCTRYLFL